MSADLLITDLVHELRQHAPFDGMNDALLVGIARHLKLVYYAKGAEVLSPASGVVTTLFIVHKGLVQSSGGRELTFAEGECFPLGPLMARRPVSMPLVAASDTFCYRLPMAQFEHLMDASPPFRHFATRRIAALLAQSQQHAQHRYATNAGDVLRLASPLKSLIRRGPVAVDPATPIRAAIEIMQQERIGSIVVTDEKKNPLGIFTERDVLNRIVLADISLARPIADVMTASPFTLPSTAPLIDAAGAMARLRIRHVLVMEEGALIGVVSERDLFAVQLLSLGEIVAQIDEAGHGGALACAAVNVRALSATLLAQGVASEALTQFVTTLNDALVSRALVLAAMQHPPPHANWCWIGLGSEGRMEQTLSTDQDNALIFSDGDVGEAHTLRPAFLKFAAEANRILDQCGFPLCTGDIMAKNPQWCLSEAEWREKFLSWLDLPEPEALLHAAIFFDFRALAGTTELAETLRQWLIFSLSHHPRFLRQCAANAILVRPPLGFIRDFVTDDAAYPGTIDLKKFAVRPFVDGARLLALSTGVAATNTAERIRLAALKLHIPAEDANAMVDGFHFVQLLRLRHQHTTDVNTDRARANRINPNELNRLDRRILKEALGQARDLQRLIEMDFLS